MSAVPVASPPHTGDEAAAKLLASCRTATEVRRVHAALLLRHARAVFETPATAPSVVSFSSIIDASAALSSDPLSDCLLLYLRMLRLGVAPNAYTFSSLLKSTGGPHSALIDAHIVKLGLTEEPYVCTALVKSYARNCNGDGDGSGDILSARVVFDKMPVRTVVCATSLITAYVELGDLGEARWVFDQMDDKDAVLWSAMIYGYTQNGRPGQSLDLFREMLLEKKTTSTPFGQPPATAERQTGRAVTQLRTRTSTHAQCSPPPSVHAARSPRCSRASSAQQAQHRCMGRRTAQ